MALTIDELRHNIDQPGGYVSDRRLCLAEDGETIVEETDPRARMLLVPKGGTVPRAVAIKLGLLAADPPAGSPADDEGEDGGPEGNPGAPNAGNAREVVARIAGSHDAALVGAILGAEEASEKPRATVVAAAKSRLDALARS